MELLKNDAEREEIYLKITNEDFEKILAALGELSKGILIEDPEFRLRLGCTRAEMKSFLAKFKKINTDQPFTLSHDELCRILEATGELASGVRLSEGVTMKKLTGYERGDFGEVGTSVRKIMDEINIDL